MRSTTIVLLLLAAETAAFTTMPCSKCTRLKAATMQEDSPKVIESIIGADLFLDEEEKSVELSAAMAATLGLVPNVVLAAGLVTGWHDETVRAACAVALVARLATALATRASLADAVASGPLALAKYMSKPVVEDVLPLNLGEGLSQDDEDAVISTLQIVADKDSVRQVRALLEAYFDESIEDTTIVQSGKTVFDVTTRFKCPDPNDSLVALREHHVSDAFLQLTEGCRAHLAIPIAIYVVTQRDGKLGNPRHPFGPGGEGGRDDAIYSSPANLDGSQVGSKIGVEAARTIDI